MDTCSPPTKRHRSRGRPLTIQPRVLTPRFVCSLSTPPNAQCLPRATAGVEARVPRSAWICQPTVQHKREAPYPPTSLAPFCTKASNGPQRTTVGTAGIWRGNLGRHRKQPCKQAGDPGAGNHSRARTTHFKKWGSGRGSPIRATERYSARQGDTLVTHAQRG